MPANLLVVPAIAPATLLGVAAAVLSPVLAGRCRVRRLAGAAGRRGGWSSWPRYGARVPAGALPWPGGLPARCCSPALTVALLVGRPATARPPAGRGACAVAAVLGALPVRLLARGWPPPGWLVVACAVGQGDAIVLAAGARAGGGGRRRPGARRRSTGACGGSAYGRCRCWWSATSTPTTSAAWPGCSGVDGWPRCVAPDWPEPAAGRDAGAGRRRYGRRWRRAAGWSYTVGRGGVDVLGPPDADARHPVRSEQQLPGVAGHRRPAVRSLLPGDAETRGAARRCWSGSDAGAVAGRRAQGGPPRQRVPGPGVPRCGRPDGGAGVGGSRTTTTATRTRPCSAG